MSINLVHAEELKDITDNVEIRYKWYKEVIEGDYYPLKENQEGYIVDIGKIKYGPVSNWSTTNCSLSDEYYFKEYKPWLTYKSVKTIRYIELENFVLNNNLKIYHDNELMEYEILKNNENTLVLDLGKNYLAETLTFYIKYDKEYNINLYYDSSLSSPMLSKKISKDEVFIPDETWKTATTSTMTHFTSEKMKQTSLTKKTSESQTCRVTEIYVYKYKVKKEYYDDNYYLNVEGYIKDVNDYKIFYKETSITNTVEIIKEKIVKQPEIEYIYVPGENEIQKIDSSENKEKTECTPQIKTQIKTEIKTIEKEIFKTPKRVYIIIALLIIITLFLVIKLYKKYVDEKF